LTFRRRIILLSAGAVTAAIAIAMVATYLMVSAQLKDQLDQNLVRSSDRAATFVMDYAGQGPEAAEEPGASASESRAEMERGLNRISRLFSEVNLPTNTEEGQRTPLIPYGQQIAGSDFYAQQIVSAGGQVTKVTSSSDQVAPSEEVLQVADGEKESFFYEDEIDGEPVRIYATQLSDGFAVEVARSMNDVNRTLGKLRWVLGIVTLFSIGIAAVFGFFVSRAALSPITRFAGAAESIAQTRDLATRMEEVEDPDLDRLARSFNTMMDALEQSLDSQQQLVVDASHELRTPLTSLRTNTEVLLRDDELTPERKSELVESVISEIDEVTNLIGGLIDLARESESESPRSQVIRLDELVEGVIERADHRTGRLTIDYQAEPCELVGVPESLERAVLNLIENAVKWAPADSEIEVRVTETGIVTVRDHGPGVADADAPYIFDRFYRSPEARGLPGSGLGLSIVRQIAENHDGTVSVSTPPGGGAQFRLDLSSRAGTRAGSPTLA